MFNSYFLPYQQLMIVSSLLFYIGSVFVFEFSRKQTFALLFLLIATLIFKIFVITADEFINLWDEQYHALVAKNLTKNLFLPTLYPDPVLPYNYTDWISNYIWVHKQPCFLIQMALSIKLFGTTAFAIRFPSVLCFTFATFCIYKIGENTLTTRIGFIGAFLFSLNYFFNEMLVGAEPTDHNDIVFMCYITASVWAFTEYLKTKVFKWMFWIAIFASFAVLTKWLPGYIVFGIWLIFLLQQKNTFSQGKKEWFDLIKTFLLSAILPAAWQIYIYTRFPLEAANEHAFNVRHITEPLDGHGGDSYFHLEALKRIIGYYSPFFVLAGVLFLQKYFKEKKMFIPFIFAVTVVYVFFTYVSTKMLGFTFIVFFIFFLGFGAIGENVYEYLKISKNIFRRILFCAALAYCGLGICDLETFQKGHTLWIKKEFGLRNFRDHNINWYNTCKEINKDLKDGKYVVFNCDNIDFIKLMFYTDHIGYSIIPDYFQINLAKVKNYKIAIIDNGKLPKYIMNDKSIVKITNVRDKVVSCDTVKLKLDKNRFLSAPESGKLVIDSIGNSFIITTFANGSTQLKTFDGKIATSRMDYGGMIVFEHKVYEIYEQFILHKKENNKYRIGTLFGENLKIIEHEKCFFTTRDPNKELIVEIIKTN